jgi:hypothetical protein
MKIKAALLKSWVCVVLMGVFVCPVRADTLITFDDVSAPSGFYILMPTGYAGFN